MTQHKTERLEAHFEIKTISTTDGTFSGYASIFGNVDQQNEIVAKGAFVKSLTELAKKKSRPAMLWMHDPRKPIGVWKSIKEDDNGLLVEGQLSLETQLGREAYELLKMGALKGMSIGFQVLNSTIDAVRKARVLTEVKLFEISIVTFPANEEANVESVKTERNFKSIREFEEFLRDEGGFSHAAARSIAERGFKARSESRDENGGLNGVLAALERATAAINPKTGV